MGKTSRIKEQHQLEQQKITPIEINISVDEMGKVVVSGAISDPVMTMDIIAAAMKSLTAYYINQRNKEKNIIMPPPNMIIPGRG